MAALVAERDSEESVRKVSTFGTDAFSRCGGEEPATSPAAVVHVSLYGTDFRLYLQHLGVGGKDVD